MALDIKFIITRCKSFGSAGKRSTAISAERAKPFSCAAGANVSVTFYAYKTDAGSGIAAGLGNIQKVKDGEPLGGASNPEDDFEVLDDDEFETEFANTDDEDEDMFE